MVDFVTAALLYADLGWRVLPLGEGSKLPLPGTHGVRDATLDGEQIRRWGKRHPHSNVGIACGEISGIVVVDIDPRHGGDDTVRALVAKGRPSPPGPRARTGNGGHHLVYRWQPGIRNSSGKLGKGIDTKAMAAMPSPGLARSGDRMRVRAANTAGLSTRSARRRPAYRFGCRRRCARR